MSHTPNISKQPKKTPGFLIPALVGLAGFTALGLVLVKLSHSQVTSVGEVVTPESLGLKDLMKDAKPGEDGTATTAPSKPAPHPVATKVASAKSPSSWTYAPPSVTEEVTPTYPRFAKLVRVEGPVEINLHVDAKGHPTEAKVLSGQTPLREEALKAAQAWRFKPAYENGRPVPSDFRVRFEFRLS